LSNNGSVCVCSHVLRSRFKVVCECVFHVNSLLLLVNPVQITAKELDIEQQRDRMEMHERRMKASNAGEDGRDHAAELAEVRVCVLWNTFRCIVCHAPRVCVQTVAVFSLCHMCVTGVCVH